MATTRTIVEAYFNALANGEREQASQYVSKDVRRWILGEGSWPLGGDQDEAGMRRIGALIRERFPDGVQLKLRTIIVDNDRAVVEAEGSMLRKDGQAYRNQYCYVLTIAGDLIVEIREYLDTIHGANLLCGRM